MILRRALLAIVALMVLIPQSAHAGKIIVTIEGLRSNGGDVFVALFSRAEGFPDGDYSDRHVKLKASTDPLTVIFDNLAPGAYAVGAYHDENGNGRLDTNFIGYPAEGYALSNSVRAIFSRPRFRDAAFAIGGEDRNVTLHIGY